MNMDSKDLQGQLDDNSTYAISDNVVVCWTNHDNKYIATGSIVKINPKSIVVSLSGEVKRFGWPLYLTGQKIKVPRIGTNGWSWNNRVYRPVQNGSDIQPTEPETIDKKEVLTFTTATESYDGFGTWTVRHHVGFDHQQRLVRLASTPIAYSEWQKGRYQSGLHLAASPEQWAELCLAKLTEEIE